MFTLADLEVALRRSIDPADQEYYQYLIDSATAYIEDITDTAFSVHTNSTVRYRADGWGIVELVGPVTSVASITPLIQSNYTYRYDGWYWAASQWDGLGEIDGLAPYEVVDVTYTYGYALADVPRDIKKVAVDAVVGVIDNKPVGTLSERTVGDISYKYEFTDSDFSSLAADVLNSYRGVAKTWRL